MFPGQFSGPAVVIDSGVHSGSWTILLSLSVLGAGASEKSAHQT